MIYTVMVAGKLTEDGFEDTRVVGYCSSFDRADKIVRDNCCDLNEACYSYAVIEEVEEGIYPYNEKRWIYKFDYDKGTYYPIEEPECLKMYANFTIG